MKKTLLFISGIITSQLGFSQVIDQKIGIPYSQVENMPAFNKNNDFYQSFKAGKTGLLDHVNLSIVTTLASKTVNASIYSGTVEDNNLSSTPLGSSTVTIIANKDSTTFSFTGIEIVNGERYSIKISTSLSPQSFIVKGKRSQTYSEGNFSLYSISTKKFATDTESDMYFTTYVTEPTGVASSKVSNNFEVYPNPTNGHELNFSTELTNISITNLLGETMATSLNSTELNLSSLQNGYYFLKCDQGFQKIQIVK